MKYGYMYYFVGYPQFSEASYFADQSGVFEVATAKDPRHGNVMQQVHMLGHRNYISLSSEKL